MTHNSNFTEKEIMDDLLMSEKQVASAYNTGITESTCPILRNLLSNCLNNIQECQYEVFSVMNQRGWYQVREADIKDVHDAQYKYSKLLNQLS